MQTSNFNNMNNNNKNNNMATKTTKTDNWVTVDTFDIDKLTFNLKPLKKDAKLKRPNDKDYTLSMTYQYSPTYKGPFQFRFSRFNIPFGISPPDPKGPSQSNKFILTIQANRVFTADEKIYPASIEEDDVREQLICSNIFNSINEKFITTILEDNEFNPIRSAFIAPDSTTEKEKQKDIIRIMDKPIQSFKNKKEKNVVVPDMFKLQILPFIEDYTTKVYSSAPPNESERANIQTFVLSADGASVMGPFVNPTFKTLLTYIPHKRPTAGICMVRCSPWESNIGLGIKKQLVWILVDESQNNTSIDPSSILPSEFRNLKTTQQYTPPPNLEQKEDALEDEEILNKSSSDGEIKNDTYVTESDEDV